MAGETTQRFRDQSVVARKLVNEARQPKPFDPRKAGMLDDPGREAWLPTRAIVSLLDPPARGRILDYGTGTARYSIAIASQAPSASIVAYDIQEELLAIARRRIRESGSTNIVVAGAGSQELRAQSFDRILALNVLHEIDLSELRRLGRLLRDGGHVLIVDWDANVPRDFGPPAKHVYSVQEATRRLADAALSHEIVAEPAFPYHYAIRARPLGP